jgi:hypothetical protein
MSYRTPKRYGFWNFILDVFLTGLTGGIWLIYVFIREMRRRERYETRYDHRCHH